MKKLAALGIVLILEFALSTCNNKPEHVFVRVFDPFYGKGIANSEIAIVELKSSVFSGEGKCNTLRHVTMDANGEGIIDGAKLKKRENYDYILKVSKAYGLDVKSAGFCQIGVDDKVIPKTNSVVDIQIIHVPAFQTGWAIKIVDLNSNANSGSVNDSISIQIYHDFDFVEGWNNQFHGSQFNGSKSKAGDFSINLPPHGSRKDTLKYPDPIAFYPIWYGKQKVVVHKRKSGIASDTSYTEIVRHDEFIHEFIISW